MKPEIFMNSFERSYFSDSIYSSIGRALTISTRFENNCKMLAIILGIKEKFFLENEQDFNEFVQILYKNDLFKNIEKILKISKDYGDILHVARISRNEIVHELTKSLEVTIDLVPKDIIKNFDTRLIKLIEKISIGDLITSLLLSFNTNEQIPNTKFLNNYRNNILVWVIDRSE